MSSALARTLAMAALVALAATHAQAQRKDVAQRFEPFQEVGIDQRIGEQVPLDARFRKHTGEELALGELFGEQPVVLALVYYRCPMLCTLVLNGVMEVLRTLPLRPGTDFQLVVVSIDPTETPEAAAEKRRAYMDSLERPGDGSGWHFLVGDRDSIDALAAAVGFRFVFDEPSREFAHASGIQVLTPEGVLSRYMYGVEYSARDLRLSLVEASRGELGSLADQVLLLCFMYDPVTGKYGFTVLTALRIGGALVVLALTSFIVVTLLRERRAARPGVGIGHHTGGAR